MMLRNYVIAFVAGLAFSTAGLAQAPAGAPAGATGQCKDGSYTTNATKRGACRGHKGVQTWFASTTSSSASSTKKASRSESKAAAAPASSAPAAAPAPARSRSTTSRATEASRTAAPGGGPGLVWVNASSNVYHCYGSRYYGKTKSGKYETEAEAKASGAHPEHGKACGQ